jgi:glycosyltransferase involved in cell wall biosynthesis
MKLLILSAVFPPHVIGGAEICAFDIARTFAARHHDVSVMTLAEPDEAEVWNEVTAHGFRLYRVRTPRAHTLFGHGKSAPLQRPFWHLQDNLDPRNRAVLARVLDDVQPDHVQIHVLSGIGFNALQELGERKLAVSYVLHDLGLACVKTTMFREGHGCERQCGSCRLLSTLKNRMVEAVPNIRFVSPSKANLATVSRFLPAVAAAKSRVIRNLPSETAPLVPRRRQNSKAVDILYAGRLHPTKGVDIMLEALQPLAPNYDFHVTVLGRSDDGGRLERTYGGLPWVTFKGFVEMDSVLAWMVRSDLVAVPSLWRENYSRTVIDALSLGTPVFGSDIGGIPEQVEDGFTGRLVAPGDVAAWREAFREVLERPELLTEWRINAKSRVGWPSFEETLAEYETFMGAATA